MLERIMVKKDYYASYAAMVKNAAGLCGLPCGCCGDAPEVDCIFVGNDSRQYRIY
jgi:hypothetical protein